MNDNEEKVVCVASLPLTALGHSGTIPIRNDSLYVNRSISERFGVVGDRGGYGGRRGDKVFEAS